jgi:hypothetical protein
MSSRSIERLAPVLLAALVAGCGPSPEALLRTGQHAELLRRVRPVGAKALRLRAAALLGQGKLVDARVELLLSLALDGRSAAAHRLMGELDGRLDAPGGALLHYDRSLELEARQPEVRTALARLLRQRAALRSDAALGIVQLEEARQDRQRADALDPRGAAPALGAESGVGSPAWGGGTPKGRNAEGACERMPAALESAGLPASGACRLPADLVVTRALRRPLLAACVGPALALRLEGQGCLDHAQAVFGALEQEAPTDARWPLHAGRLLLAEGRRAAAEQRFTDHVYLSGDRAAAQLRVARLLLLAGRPREAGARAVLALALAGSLGGQLQAMQLLRRCGLPEAVRQAEATVLSRGWGLSAAELRTRLDRVP